MIGARASVVAATATVAYVSAAPGSLPGGFAVSIRNERINSPIEIVPVVNGGFDPIGIVADPGDNLSLTILNADHTSTVVGVKVPPQRPPQVVRTQPPKGRVDVALNVQIFVVFSEPVNKSTVTNTSVRLLRNGGEVSGSIELSDGALVAAFVPNGLLEPQTAYTLAVSSTIRDLDGDPLSEPVNIEFTTGAGVSVDDFGLHEGFIAFSSERDGNSEIYVAHPDGTNVVRLTNNSASDFAPSWSPDGEHIAFVSDRDGAQAIYQMNADGSNVSRLTDPAVFTSNPDATLAPAWSPDGRVVFSGQRRLSCASGSTSCDGSETGIYAVASKVGQSEPVRVGPNETAGFSDPRDPAWSPDGQRIAFARGTGKDMASSLSVMNANGSNVVAPLWNGGLFWYEVKTYHQPAWSPDGKYLAFTFCSQAPNMSLSDLCSAGSSIRILRADSFVFAEDLVQGILVSGAKHPAWSPDGRVIAFSSRICSTCTPIIRYVTPSGASIEAVVVPNADAPAWKPQ